MRRSPLPRGCRRTRRRCSDEAPCGPSSQVVRYDQNTPPLPLPSTRPGAIAAALAGINGYPAGGYIELRRAIADYTGVDLDQIVLGVGADDLILLCARSFAGPGDTIAIPASPTYPLYRIAALLAGAEVGDDEPVLTFTCRPSSPTGELRPMPDARPLVVDEAYYEYCGETAVPLLGDGVIVLRTFSKAFALAGARIGYALASKDVAAELNARQAPAPVSSVSAALAIAALAAPPDVTPVIEERDRLRSALHTIGLAPLPSRANFLYVPFDDGRKIGDALLRQGLVVRAYDDGIRITIRDQADDGIYDHFLEQLAFHGGLDLDVEAAGDLETGDHHTVEDTALAFGEALDKALGDRRGIARYGDAVVPMDDALARAAVDLGGRPFAELSFETEPGMAAHFFTSLAQAGRMAIHIEATGRDPHHTAEAAYKAVGRALKTALRQDSTGIPSTKGLL